VIIKDPIDLIQKTWAAGNFYETQRNGLLNFIAANYKGGSFVDCGAYIGNHTLFFYKICQANQVYCFEPNIEAFNHLKENLIVNDLGFCAHLGGLFNFALGSSEKQDAGLIHADTAPDLGGKMMTRVNKSGRGTSIKTLDAVLENKIIDRLTFIKIDCEGMGLEVLMGAKTTIRKYRPDISVESETGYEEIDSFLLPLGYEREPFILNHTPTYIYKSKQHNVQIRLLITTYNRIDKLTRLLTQLGESLGRFAVATGVIPRTVVDVWNDGGQKVEVRSFPNLICHYHEETQNNGKQGYWRLIAKAYQNLLGKQFDYFIQLPDDVEINEDFLNESITQWSLISDKCKISLNLLLDKARVGRLNWTNHIPTIQSFRGTHVFLTQWNDLCFICDERFFKALQYTIHPIPLKRWQNNPNLSSGVGQQISRRLFAQKFHMYQVRTSLVLHGDHQSRMNSEIRSRVSLRSCILEEIHCGVASYPPRIKSLEQAVESIINQVDFLHVYLNGYSYVPKFLNRDKIHVYLSQDHLGDLGDSGKFFQVGTISGYYFSIDDDLLYPEGYVWYLIDKIEQYKRRAVIGVHARTMKPIVKSFYRDKARIYHCLKQLRKDQITHVLGTGTTAFHSETMQIRIADFEIPNMADIWFAILGQQQRVPFIAVARKNEWLKLTKLNNPKDTIYGRFANTDEVQTIIYNRIKNWKLNFL
jgi:FkbM family methyltransferase